MQIKSGRHGHGSRVTRIERLRSQLARRQCASQGAILNERFA